jgi:hypothetical protein
MLPHNSIVSATHPQPPAGPQQSVAQADKHLSLVAINNLQYNA